MCIVDKKLRSSMLFAIFSVVIGSAALAGPAWADRPGTPNGISLGNCPFSPSVKPRLCGSFLNTATEEVTFEIEVSKNEAPISLKIDCFNFDRSAGLCWWPSHKYTKSKLDQDLERQGTPRPLVFEMTGLEFNAKYCVRLRARRVSDQMVSEIWSAGACAKTPAPPSPPGAPEFTVKFDGRQPVPNGPAIADTLSVTYTKLEGGHSTLVIRDATGPDSFDGNKSVLFSKEHGAGDASSGISISPERPDVYRISPASPWLYIEVCSSNISGRACSHKVVSASAESVAAPTPGGKPIAVTTRGGTDQTFQPEINLPGMDYKNQPLRTNDPEACQQLCNNEAACVAWTFVRAGVQSDRPMCWLKNNIPHAVRDPNTVSGIKKTPHQPYLYHTDMPGKDYRQVAGSVWGDCERVCNQETQCKAWTWLPPGVQGPRAMCSLKTDVPARVANEQAVSGVKVGNALPPAPPPAAQPNSAPPPQPPPAEPNRVRR